ncbi:hypothetical protein Taro_054362, partial [Colocasia esculenta]|nr:hypothetical protein [Colocasia esculenta]
RFRFLGGKLWPFYRRRVGIRAHRELLPPSGSGIRAPDRKSPSLAQGRPGRSEDSELGPRGRFRSPSVEISTFYRSGAKIGVLVAFRAPGSEFHETGVFSTGSERRFRRVVT